MSRKDIIKKMFAAVTGLSVLFLSQVTAVSAQDSEVKSEETVAETVQENDGEHNNADVKPDKKDELPPYEIGIDISRYQEDINFDLLEKDENAKFAILRAGTSRFGIDSRFEEYYKNLHERGIRTGAYFYCSSVTLEGFIRDAHTFLKLLEGKQMDMPVYFDMEDNDQLNMSKDNMTYYTLCALNILRDAGYTAGVYSNKWWFTSYVNKELMEKAGFEIWWAQYINEGPYFLYDQCGIWQYSCHGRVQGIAGDVDMDIAYKFYPEEKEIFKPEKWITGGDSPVRFRSGPGLEFRQIESISINPHRILTVNDIVEANEYKWGRVSYGGYSGWCVLDYSMKFDESNEYILKYDIDGDEYIDGNDAMRVKKNILFNIESDKACDVSGDGSVDILDFMRIKKELLR